MIPIFEAKNINSRIIIKDKNKFNMFLSTLPKEVQVIVRKPRKIRSNEQNKYLHGYLFKELGEFLGYSLDEMKEILKAKFLKRFKTIKTKKGMVEVEYICPTSLLSTVELEFFATQIREWASIELEFYLKLPNEVD